MLFEWCWVLVRVGSVFRSAQYTLHSVSSAMLFEWWWVLVRVGAGAARGALYLPMVSPSSSSSSSSSQSSLLSLRWSWKSESHKQNLKGLYVPSTTTVFTVHLSVPLLSSVANGGLNWEGTEKVCKRVWYRVENVHPPLRVSGCTGRV